MRVNMIWSSVLGILSFGIHANAESFSTSVVLESQSHRVTVEDSASLAGEHAAVRFEGGAVGIIGRTLIVGYKSKASLRHYFSAAPIELIDGIEAARITLSSPAEVLDLSRTLAGNSDFRYVHPDFKFTVEARQGDPTQEPLFKEQWNLFNQRDSTGVDIGILEAWAVTKGHPDVVIGLLDLGFEQSHEDLRDAWYINTNEIPDNKKDDDGNGLVDDVKGWNFSINGTNLIYGADSKHGTATSGIIAARTNGFGIAGICPLCKVLPIVVSGRVSEDAAAILYAMRMNVSVMSNSWGYNLEPPRTDVVSDALRKAATEGRGGKGIPIVFAMHNSAVDDCKSSNPDISGHPNVIAVSSVDFEDLKVPQSGYGRCLAFVAPSSGSSAHGIVTTDRAGDQGYNRNGTGNFPDLSYHNGFWGTSAAAPQVSGLFALLLSHEPHLTRDEALGRLRGAAVKVRPLEANYDSVTGHSLKYGYGRVSAHNLFQP